MKFSCTQENLSRAIGLTSSIAGKNPNLPILNNVLIRANDQTVEVISTNLDVAITTSFSSLIETPGSFTVPAKTLNDFIILLSEDKIEIELKNNEIGLYSGSSSTKIKGLSAEEFPIIPTIDNGQVFTLKAEDLRSSLSQVLVAVARNDIRPELSGIFLSFNKIEKLLTLAATDSYRLAEKSLPIVEGTTELKAILPGKTAQEIVRILSSERESGIKEVKITVNDNQIGMVYNHIHLTSRLIAGDYPDYTQIIPREFSTSASFSVDQLKKEIRAAGLFTSTGSAVEIKISPDKGALELLATSPAGEYSSQVTSEITGAELKVFLSHRYLLDGLNNISSSQAIFKTVSADSPCVLTSEADKSFVYIVMPIRQ